MRDAAGAKYKLDFPFLAPLFNSRFPFFFLIYFGNFSKNFSFNFHEEIQKFPADRGEKLNSNQT
jgi:hypothetical protein